MVWNWEKNRFSGAFRPLCRGVFYRPCNGASLHDIPLVNENGGIPIAVSIPVFAGEVTDIQKYRFFPLAAIKCGVFRKS